MLLKRIKPLLLALLLVIVVSGCSSDDELTDGGNGTGEEVVDGGPELGEELSDEYFVDVVEGSSLAIRETPGTGDAADVIDRLDRNTTVMVVDKHNNSVEENNYIWWEIVIPATQERGWAASDFLSDTVLAGAPVSDAEDGVDQDYDPESFNPDNYVGASRAEFMNKYGYPDRTEIKGGIEFNHYKNLDAIVCYSRWINKSTIIKVRNM